MTPARPIIEARAIHKHFGALHVLRGVDFTVEERQLVFVIGPSGSGKSTLLRCLNRLEEPSSGMVFQSFNLYPHMTALGNVMLALRKVQGLDKAEAEARAQRALDRVHLADRADHYPNQLSGGQQQRVAIARSIALEPRVMLFDEPTSALDPELVGGVLAVMRELREDGMTMVVVSHEMSFARAAADRVVFMADGEILEQGPPAEIFSAPHHERLRAFISQVERH
jgi:ABC-type polar amino acid transport system ATPase subunit